MAFVALGAAIHQVATSAQAGSGLLGEGERANRNVVAFHGMQGVGKSAFSREAARALASTDRARLPHVRGRVAVARVELDKPGQASIENVLLTIRAALGRIHPSWPGFDLAFTVMWARRHPGMPLDSRGGALTQLAGDYDVIGGIEDTLKDLLLDSHWAAKVVTGTGKLVFGRAIEEAKRRRLLARYPDLLRFLEPSEEPPEWDELAELLALDLAALQEHRVPQETTHLIVVLDSFECVQSQGRARIEEELAWLAYQMPNALFVICGVHRLRWGDEHHVPQSLEIGGPEVWPGLAQRDQHVLDKLGHRDAQALLIGLLEKAGVTISSDHPAVEAVLKAADGLPEYLRLSAIRLTRRGLDSASAEGDLEVGYPRLVGQVFEDLTRTEQDLLRHAALLSAVGDELLIWPGAPWTHGEVCRFLELPLFERSGGAWPPLSLHRAFRTCIRRAQPDTRPWSEADWRNAADSILDRLGELASAVISDREVQDAERESTLFLLGVELVDVAQRIPDWVIALGDRLGRFARWDTFRELRPGQASDEVTPEMGLRDAIADGFLGEMARVHASATDGVRLLSAALEHPAIQRSPVASGAIRVRLSSALQDAGDFRAAQSESRVVAHTESPFRSEGERQVVWLELASGKLQRSQTTLSRLLDRGPEEPLNADRVQKGATLTMLARIDEAHGRLGDAIAKKREALELGLSVSDAGGQARLLSHLAQAACYAADADVVADIETGLRLELEAGQSRQLARLRASLAVARTVANGRPADDIDDLFSLALDDARRAGSRWSQIDVRFASLFVDAWNGVALSDAERGLVEIDELAEAVGGFRWMSAISRAFWDERAPDVGGTEWCEPWPVVRERWRRLAGRT